MAVSDDKNDDDQHHDAGRGSEKLLDHPNVEPRTPNLNGTQVTILFKRWLETNPDSRKCSFDCALAFTPYTQNAQKTSRFRPVLSRLLRQETFASCLGPGTNPNYRVLGVWTNFTGCIWRVSSEIQQNLSRARQTLTKQLCKLESERSISYDQ